MATAPRFRTLVKFALRPLVRAIRKRRTDLPEALWRLDRDAGGYLCLNSVRLEALLERWGSPLHVIDTLRLEQNIADFVEVPAGAQRGIEIYYSYKSNPIPAVLSRLHAHGVGAEVISAYELWLALRQGVPPERIVFNGPGRSIESLKLAVERGILIHLNNREEIDLVAWLAAEVGRKARVGIRVTTASGWNAQFGESIPSGSALEAFREASHRAGLSVVALHCHHGREIATEDELRGLLEQLVSFLAQLRAQLRLSPDIVDIGGCLASQTVTNLSLADVTLNQMFGTDLVPRRPDDVLSIRRYTALVASVFERACKQADVPRPRIFAEPGRAMTGNAQMLLCRVVNVKAASGSDPVHAVLDAGVNIAEPVKNRYHQLFALGPAGGRPREPYRLVGPICTPMDILYPSWELPQLKRGDGLAIMDSGAYFIPFSTSFSFPQPAIVALDGKEEHLVRRRETFDDMIKRDMPLEIATGNAEPSPPSPPDEAKPGRISTANPVPAVALLPDQA